MCAEKKALAITLLLNQSSLLLRRLGVPGKSTDGISTDYIRDCVAKEKRLDCRLYK